MVDVSIILPVYNAELWLEDCLQSVYDQTFSGCLELSAYNDSSTDRSHLILEKWRNKLEKRNIQVIVSGPESWDAGPGGVGHAKNRAIWQSSGEYLCFLDADDVMHPERIEKQLRACQEHPDALIGSRFHRDPPSSTERFTKWANGLTREQLLTQIYTSHGPTIIMPTWFCSRESFNSVGPWDESGKGCPEDLLYFYKHMNTGRGVIRVPDDLLLYRYHPGGATFSVNEETIWNLRVAHLENQVLKSWYQFTIWNAGKQGRKLYRSLKKENQDKVSLFCDVDVKKISKQYYTYEESVTSPKPKIPIVHFTDARPPIIICVKQDLTGGGFEDNLKSLNLKEGIDFFHFN